MKIGLFSSILFALLATMLMVQSVAGAEIKDAAVRFYIDKIDSVLNRSILFNPDTTFEIELSSAYTNINYRGVTDATDTAVYTADFKGGLPENVQIIDTAALDDNTTPPALNFEKPWAMDCRFFFYPNDTGAGDLAIGFEPLQSDSLGIPSGLIIIDRDKYLIRSIYLHYSHIEKYLWLSKQYKFNRETGGPIPDSILIQGCFYGFFQRRYFQQKIDLREIIHN